MFPAGTITTQEAWTNLCAIALRMRKRTVTLRDASAAGETGRTSYPLLQQQLDDALEKWAELVTTPGLEDYARGQINTPQLDLGVEYTTMRNGAATLKNWIFANAARDPVSGADLEKTTDEAGDSTELTYTTAQTVGFRTEADAFIATIKPTV